MNESWSDSTLYLPHDQKPFVLLIGRRMRSPYPRNESNMGLCQSFICSGLTASFVQPVRAYFLFFVAVYMFFTSPGVDLMMDIL